MKEAEAVNCRNNPTTSEGFAGKTVIDTTVALVTARLADALIEPEMAVITVVPGASPEASPAPMLATLGTDEAQETAAFRS